MRALIGLGILLVLGGCMITDRDPLLYTRADIDAINARQMCKLLARNLVQVARCDTR